MVKKSQQEQIKQYVENETNYKANSVRISKDGMVSARLDADKTFNGPHSERFNVGWANEILKLKV